MNEKTKLTVEERVLLRREIAVVAFNLRRLRIAAGLERTPLAEMIRAPRQQIFYWESGDHTHAPPVSRLAQLAVALGVDSLAEFFRPIPIGVTGTKRTHKSVAK